jgi:hypothetical protein
MLATLRSPERLEATLLSGIFIMGMDRAGSTAFLIALIVAFVGSLPFMASVVSGVRGGDAFAGALAWQAWALAAAIGFVGVVLIALGDATLSPGRHGRT